VLQIFSHHKCGTTWLGWLLQDLSATNDLSFFRSHLGYEKPSPSADISFLTNSTYEAVRKEMGSPGLHVIRNPLNIVLSAYHSHLKTHSVEGWPELDTQRHILQEVSFGDGLLLTIAFLESDHFYRGTPGPLYSLRNWNYADERVQTLRMEDMVLDVGNLLRLFNKSAGKELVLTDMGRFEFQNFTQRKVGEIDSSSHYRSGSAEQWRKELTAPAISYIKAHYHDLMSRFYPDALA